MTKMLYSTDKMPLGIEVKEMFPMIQFTGAVEISKKSLMRSIFEKNKNEYQIIMDNLIAYAPHEANAIIGVQVSTAAQSFNNVTNLYVTYIGTPAIIGPVESNK